MPSCLFLTDSGVVKAKNDTQLRCTANLESPLPDHVMPSLVVKSGTMTGHSFVPDIVSTAQRSSEYSKNRGSTNTSSSGRKGTHPAPLPNRGPSSESPRPSSLNSLNVLSHSSRSPLANTTLQALCCTRNRWRYQRSWSKLPRISKGRTL